MICTLGTIVSGIKGNVLDWAMQVGHVDGLKYIQPHPNNVFGLHQLVDAFHNGGWCPGVVSKLPSNGDGLYSVCFPASREEFVFNSLDLRRSMEWFVKGKWFSVDDDLLDDQEREHVIREGTRIQVCRDRENFGAAWFVATVVKRIGRTYFLVEYANLKVDSGSSTEHPLKEIVNLHYIRRHCPPMPHFSCYNVPDEVEVFGGIVNGDPSFQQDNSSQPCIMDGGSSRSDNVPEIQMVKGGLPCSGSSLPIVDNVCNEEEFSFRILAILNLALSRRLVILNWLYQCCRISYLVYFSLLCAQHVR